MSSAPSSLLPLPDLPFIGRLRPAVSPDPVLTRQRLGIRLPPLQEPKWFHARDNAHDGSRVDLVLARQRPDIELPPLPVPPVFQRGSWTNLAHPDILATPHVSAVRVPARVLAVEVDLTRLIGVDTRTPIWLDDVLGILAHAVATSLREAAPSIAAPASAQPIDIVLSPPDGSNHLITDADRLTISEMLGAVAGRHECPAAEIGLVKPRPTQAAIRVAVTCSGAAGFLYLVEPLQEDVAIGIDLGCPVRRPVLRLDDTGQELLAFRTVSTVTVQSPPLVPPAQVMAVLGSVRDVLEGRAAQLAGRERRLGS